MATPGPDSARPDSAGPGVAGPGEQLATAAPLVTLGETMGVLIPAAAGPLHRGAGLRLSVAGSESNVAIGVRRLGVAATWIGRVGPDEVGDLILRELRAEDVAVRVVRDRAPTGMMLKTTRAAGITRVSYFRAASAGSRLAPEDLDEGAIAAAGVLHVTGITPALGPRPAAAVHAAIEIARAAGAPVSLDVNYRAALWDAAAAGAALRDLARRADILFAGEHEARLLADPGDPAGPVGPAGPAAMARELAGLGPRQVLIKRGQLGSVALIDGRRHEQPALPVLAVDPVGAGDAFVAGYLAELLAGRPPAARLATAAAAGAFAVTVSGDWEGLPTRAELDLLDAPDDVIR
jgi:2-dehydro-3-deoxygluconokinase